MQREIGDEIDLSATVSSFDNVRVSSAIDRTGSIYNDAKEKVKKVWELIKTRKYDTDVVKYIPGVLKMVFPGMLDEIENKEKVAPTRTCIS